MPPKDPTQVTECVNLPINSPFRGLSRCFRCETVQVSRGGKTSKATRSSLCAFKGRRMIVGGEVTFCSGETLSPNYPSTWNRRPTVNETNRTLRQIAEHLLPIMDAELHHTEDIYVLVHPRPLWFRRELMVRVVCDRCRSTLFAGAFICEDCGREWCSRCCDESFPTCLGHATNFRRVSRFQDRDEIVAAVAQMKEIIRTVKLPVPPEGEQKTRHYKVLQYPVDDYPSWRDWMDCLRRGAPLVVQGSTQALQREYDFHYLSEALIGTKIMVTNVLDTSRVEVRDAFQFFFNIAAGVHRDEIDQWKIKDFPPRNAFRVFLGPLALDLDQNWPFQSSVAISGVLNIMSRVPNNSGVPNSDVGPKLYGSPGIPEVSNKASTALHMDLMDAINMSLSADKSDPSTDPVAVWHIFAAHDCEKLRTYLNAKYKDDPNRPEGDLIHSQWVYFTDEMLVELEAQTGVRPWIIHQAPGDTVFIPARCPHQVRNCVWTLKTAIDFLSGDALLRTAQVAEELRRHRLVDETLDDVLQLPHVLWHAWVSFNKEKPDVMKMEKSQKVKKRKAGEGSGRRGTSHGNQTRRLRAAVE